MQGHDEMLEKIQGYWAPMTPLGGGQGAHNTAYHTKDMERENLSINEVECDSRTKTKSRELTNP